MPGRQRAKLSRQDAIDPEDRVVVREHIVLDVQFRALPETELQPSAEDLSIWLDLVIFGAKMPQKGFELYFAPTSPVLFGRMLCPC